jgi:hypothetical protein
MKTNQVFTCENKECSRFLFEGFLLDIIINGVTYSLNSNLNHFQYFSENNKSIDLNLINGNYMFKETLVGICPHCSKNSKIITVNLSLETNKKQLYKDLDELDNLISDLMGKFEEGK